MNNMDNRNLINKVELKISFLGILAEINFWFKPRKSYKYLGTPIDFAIFLLLVPIASLKTKISHI